MTAPRNFCETFAKPPRTKRRRPERSAGNATLLKKRRASGLKRCRVIKRMAAARADADLMVAALITAGEPIRDRLLWPASFRPSEE